LVDAEAVEAHLARVLEHVEVLVVELVAALGVVEAIRHIDPDAVVTLPEVGREPAVRHQMKPAELHAGASSRTTQAVTPARGARQDGPDESARCVLAGRSGTARSPLDGRSRHPWRDALRRHRTGGGARRPRGRG